MPSSEYASASGGALRMKGAKVEKHKKKHKKDKKDRKEKKDKARAERAGELIESDDKSDDKSDGKDFKDKGKEVAAEPAFDDDDPYARMTPAERRFAEAQDKKIRTLMHATPEEAKAARPDLFKSHKERLADLNTYLSRMSEHNDMPKIGPG